MKQATSTFRGHNNTVTSLCWASHGTQVVTGSLDKTAVLWKAETAELLSVLEGHTKGVYSVDWSPDGNFVSTGSSDCTARLWDVGSGLELHCYGPDLRSIVWSTSFTRNGEGLLVGYADGNARLWDVEEGAILQTLQGHASWVVDCKCSPVDENRYATASKDGSAIIWDGRTTAGTCIASKVPLICLDWSPDGHYLVTGSKDCRMRIWDTRKLGECELRLELTPLPYEVLSCSWSPLGHYIATTCADECVRVYDSESGSKIEKFQGHQGSITCSQWAPNGRDLVSGSADNTAKVWNIDELELEGEGSPRAAAAAQHMTWPKPEKDGVLEHNKNKQHQDLTYMEAARRSGDSGNLLEPLNANRDSAWVNVYARRNNHVGSDDPAGEAELEDDFVETISTGLGRRRMSFGSSDKNLDILEEFRLPLGNSERYSVSKAMHRTTSYSFGTADCSWLCKEQNRLETERGVTHCTISEDMSKLAATCKDKTIILYERDGMGSYCTKDKITEFENKSPPSCFAFSKERDKGASGHYNGNVVFWDFRAQEPSAEFVLAGHTKTITGLAWNPADTSTLVTSSHDSTAVIWDLFTRTAKYTLNGHTAYVRDCSWSPNGKYLVTASSDNSAIVWSNITGQSVSRFTKHKCTIYVARWSPDSTRIATGCRDGAIQIYSMYMKRVDRELFGHRSEIRSLAWSPKGNLLLSGSWDGKVMFWDAETGKCMHVAQMHSGAVKSLHFAENGQSFTSASLDSTLAIFQLSAVVGSKEFFNHCQKAIALHNEDNGQMKLMTKHLEECFEHCRGEDEDEYGNNMKFALQVVQSAMENVHIAMKGMVPTDRIADNFTDVKLGLDQCLDNLKECLLQLGQKRKPET